MNRSRTHLWAKVSFLGVLNVCAAGSSGCHSAFVETTIDNQSASAVRLVEVDYPSASFGVSSIDVALKVPLPL